MLGVWLVNAIFTKKFTTFDKVTLKTDTSGYQLPAPADVKVRGVIVGEVTTIDVRAATAPTLDARHPARPDRRRSRRT